MKSSFAAIVGAISLLATAQASPIQVRQASSAASSVASSASSRASSAASSATSRSSSSSSSRSGSATATSSGSSSASTAATNSSGTFNATSDVDILNYALTLEHLEAAFYNTSIGQLSTADFEAAGLNDTDRNQIYSIGLDEAQHVAFLEEALGDDAVEPCTYNFSTVTDVQSMLATARLLEGVGISAYLNAAGYIANKTYLGAAGAILTVEARHQSALNAIASANNTVPASYDTPLNFTGVYSLAAAYIESCPTDLGIQPFPGLTISLNQTNSTADAGNATSAAAALPVSFYPGDVLNVQQASNASNSTSGEANSTVAQYVAIISGPLTPVFLLLNQANNTVTLPSNITGGQFYAVLTSSNDAVTDDNTIAGPAIGYVDLPLPVAPAATATAAASTSSSSATASGSDSQSGSSTDSASSTDAGASASSGASSAASTAVAGASSIASEVSAAIPTATASSA